MHCKTNLMPHQQDAVDKLLPVRVGALFMEMGTGKTRTALELIYRKYVKLSRVVWFCPVSLKETIRYEILKHTDTQGGDICVFDQHTSDARIPTQFWCIVGIESMSASDRVVLTVNKLIDDQTMVVVDESSYIKGHASMRTQRITVLSERARYRLILTGTPISQGVVDLYAQMRFLSPQILGYASFYSFAANHLEYSDKYPGMIVRSHNTEWIAAKIKPYVYQVTKEECLSFPDKLYETRYCHMSWEQLEMYEAIKEDILSHLDSDFAAWFDRIAILKLFSALQQVVCGFLRYRWYGKPRKVTYTFAHERVEVLLSAIGEVPTQDKIIIWAKYRYDIEQIKAQLMKHFGADAIAEYHGGLREEQREASIARFRTTARFFLATPSCGGHGLTLNEAHYVIFYNNGFKYAERLQAEDRCHRIGQTQKVVYIDIVCAAAIDERIMRALATKGNVVDAFKAEVDKVKDQRGKMKELVKNL